ncbi:hypothetical protein [Halorarius halobius]|uniref:hypothetical protein n=1 Tax=Halorarius halobius TaxID=2962671 RepID=UPI0020CEC614|nr:hypothetical protein [Halorarius halobius]
MWDRLYDVAGEALLVAGLVLFFFGAVVVVAGGPVDTTVLVAAALALVFVGLGASLKARGRTRSP